MFIVKLLIKLGKESRLWISKAYVLVAENDEKYAFQQTFTRWPSFEKRDFRIGQMSIRNQWKLLYDVECCIILKWCPRFSRACGNIFCNGCTRHRLPLPYLGYKTPERVCDRCYATVSRYLEGENVSFVRNHFHRSCWSVRASDLTWAERLIN